MRTVIWMVLCTVPIAAPAFGAMEEELVVQFERDSVDLSAKQQSALDGVAQWLRANPQREVVLAGLASWPATGDAEEQLSVQRAEAAAEYLRNRGVSDDQIAITSFADAMAASQGNPNTRRIVFETSSTASTQSPAGTTMAGPGFADDSRTTDPGIDEVTGLAEEDKGIGVAFMAGAGAKGFVSEGARDVADVGQQWDARMAIGTRSYVGGEVAYIGSHNDLDVSSNGSNYIVGNGIEGNLRINFTTMDFQPYIFAGVGWTNYQVGGAPTNAIQDDNQVHIPTGLGLAYHAGPIMIDVRGTFRTTLEDEAFAGVGAGDDGPSMDNWGASARLGFEFD